jgi:hypothetical protein
MKTITKPGDNLGGVVKLWAIPRSVVSVSGTTVTMSSTADVWQLYITPETGMFTEEPERPDAGLAYNPRIEAFIPRDSDAVRTAVTTLEAGRWAVLFDDGNGATRIAGADGAGLRCAGVPATGRQVAERAGYNITFAGKNITRALYVTNPFE